MTAWLALIGIGEDGVDGLSQRARDLLRRAALVAGGARHLALADGLIGGARLAWPRPMEDAYPAMLARRGQDVAVLASGDPYFFGVGSALSALVPPADIVCVPAPSSLSLACAWLGWAQQDVTAISFCGRPLEAAIPLLWPGVRMVALSADGGTPAAFSALLTGRGFGASRMHAMEALGGPRERVRCFVAGDGPPAEMGALNVVAAELVGPAGAALSAGQPDEAFAQDGQITKREVRAATLAALAPRGGEVLWDVGAGSGSIGIEWCRHGRGTRAVAIEARPHRAAFVRDNARAFGVALEVVLGEAPGALAGLPPPDAVFVGGGLQRPGVLEAAWDALPPGGRLVANAVALETQAILFARQVERGGTLTRIAVERLDRIGSMRAFRPAMAVVQWAVTK